MEYKGTVIKLNRGGILSDIEVDSYNNGAEAQAKISFKAGYEQREKDPFGKEDRCDKCYKQGIREVVEWMNEPCTHIETTSETPIYRWGCSRCWQDFKKERGL